MVVPVSLNCLIESQLEIREVVGLKGETSCGDRVI